MINTNAPPHKVADGHFKPFMGPRPHNGASFTHLLSIYDWDCLSKSSKIDSNV